MAVERATPLPEGSGTSERVLASMSIIGSACEALCAGPAIGPITLSVPIGDMGVATLRKLAFRIAERHSLLVEVDIQGAHGVLRLRWPEGGR